VDSSLVQVSDLNQRFLPRENEKETLKRGSSQRLEPRIDRGHS